jgi:hypothetical protein
VSIDSDEIGPEPENMDDIEWSQLLHLFSSVQTLFELAQPTLSEAWNVSEPRHSKLSSNLTSDTVSGDNPVLDAWVAILWQCTFLVAL